MLRIVAVFLALLAAAPIAAAPVTLASPDGRTVFSLDTDNDGRALWSLARDGKPLIRASRLGFLLTDQPKLERGFAIGAVTRSQTDSKWEQPWGERRFVADRRNSMTVDLANKDGRHLLFDVSAGDNGVGFRYRFPDQAALKTVNIAEELTEFNFARGATAWAIKAYDWNREEQIYRKTPLVEVGLAQTPFTLRFDDGTHMAIHEAALVDYAAMNLAHVEGLDFKALLTPSNRGAKVTRTGPFATPWRVLLIADSAPGLYNASDLILNLNEPNKLGDVSWVHPCKYAGIWWGMHLGKQTWSSGPTHGATTANALKMIDWAKANGMCGLLIEGWNVGWDGNWFGSGEDFSFTKAYPDFDLPKVAGYAKANGIRLIGHHETGGNIARYEEQMGAGFDLYQSLGVGAVKTGYVADAGGIRVKGPDGGTLFTWHESQDTVRHHLLVVTEAAKRHIAIDAHEPVKDTGLRRTYPNWVSREDARGQEYNAWGNPDNPPEHESTLFYTRMLGGPMDFTPGVLSLTGKNGQIIPSTIAKQLALYLVIYSPIQMAADLPENYAKFPKAFQFIKDVAVDWEESRALMGEVGDYAVVARKARGTGEWFLGATGGAVARDIVVPLDFLEPGKRYRAEIYRDGPTAGWPKNPFDIVIETRTMARGDTLALHLGEGGGAAVRFVAMTR